jgi:hypothetical protein
VSARYWIRVALELWESRSGWTDVEGWRVLAGPDTQPASLQPADWVEVLVEDDNAPPELDGKLVDVTLQSTDEGVIVMSRQVLE